MKIFARIALIFLVILAGWRCSTEVDINAPAKDIWIVYGVLNQADSTQYIRVAKAFLPQSDALVFAKENDPAVKGLKVALVPEGGTTLVADQVDDVLKDDPNGTFFPTTTLYKFTTSGDDQLVPGKRYTLRVTRDGDDDFGLTSHTYVPLSPEIVTPSLINCSSGTSLSKVRLQNAYTVIWRPGKNDGRGKGFEVRAYFEYEENGVPRQLKWGPTNMITEKQGCTSSSSTFCYQIRERELLSYFISQMNVDPNKDYQYPTTPTCVNVEDLPTNFSFEITAVDSNLTDYLQINDPQFTDFNTVRPEFSNIVSTDTTEAIGVFGSTTTFSRYAIFHECTEFLLGLNGTPKPVDCNP